MKIKQNPYDSLRKASLDPYYNLMLLMVYTAVRENDQRFFKSKWGYDICTDLDIDAEHMINACKQIEQERIEKIKRKELMLNE